MRLLLTAFVGLLFLAGCGGGGDDGEGVGGGEEPGVEAIVARAAEATAALESFHFRFAVENPPSGTSGLTLTFAEGELAVPDRLHAEVTGTLSGVPLESELVAVGERHFLRDPFTQEWRALDANISPVDFLDPAKGVLAIIRGASELEPAGSGDAGGAATYRLRGKVRASELTSILGNSPSDRLVDLELEVGKEDFRLRRILLTGPVEEDEPPDVVRIVELSGFDEPVTIAPPEVSE